MGLELLEYHREWVLRNLPLLCGPGIQDGKRAGGQDSQSCPGMPDCPSESDELNVDAAHRILPDNLFLHGGLVELHLEWAHRELNLPGPDELLGDLTESGGLLGVSTESSVSAKSDGLRAFTLWTEALIESESGGLLAFTSGAGASAKGKDKERLAPLLGTECGRTVLCRLKDGSEEKKWERLRLWLRGYAGHYLGARLAALSALHDLPYSRMRIGWQSSRWGSYSAQGSISLNAKLVFLPLELCDIVLLHELCHSVEMSHNERFHAFLRRCEPRADELEKELGKSWVWLPSW
jgi:hypothetical protein